MTSIAMYTILFLVVTLHIHRCVDYCSLVNFLWHHPLLGYTFHTIVMSQVALWYHDVHCLLLVLSWHHCWCFTISNQTASRGCSTHSTDPLQTSCDVAVSFRALSSKKHIVTLSCVGKRSCQSKEGPLVAVCC